MTYRSKFIFFPHLSAPGEGGMGVFLERPDGGLSIWSCLKIKFAISVLGRFSSHSSHGAHVPNFSGAESFGKEGLVRKGWL